MFEILLKPVETILAAKKSKDIGKTFLMLLTASIVAAVGVLFMTKFSNDSVMLAIMTIVAAFVGAIVLAYLVMWFMKIIVKKSTFYSALTMITYGFFVMSWAYGVISILFLIPYIGVWLSGLVMMFAFVIANAVMLKAGMTFFETDIITVIIALFLMYIAVISTTQFVLIELMFGSFSILTGGALGNPYYPSI